MFVLLLTTSLTSTTSFAKGESGFNHSMKPVLSHYLNIHKLLAADSRKGLNKEVKSLLAAMSYVNKKNVTGKNTKIYRNIKIDIKRAGTALLKSKNLEDARNKFSKLSEPIVAWTKISKPGGVQAMYCPMKDASWVQKSNTTKNPYYGRSMLTCGSKI